MTLPIIAINVSGGEVIVEDLGIILPADSTAVLSDIFLRHQIQDSTDLKTKINGGDIVINDGSQTLNQTNSIKHVTFETEYEDKEDLGPGYWVGNTAPDPNEFNGWYNTDDKILYSYDENRGKWLSVNRRLYQFTKSGELNGNEYLKIGEVQTNDAGYTVPRNGSIVGISGRVASGSQSKGFEVRVNESAIKSFSLSNGQITDSTCDINISIEDVLQCFSIFEADPGESFDDWAYLDRPYRRKITLKSSEVGGNIVYDNASSNSGSSASSVSVSHTVSAGITTGIFVFASTENASGGGAPNGATFNSVNMTQIATAESDNGSFENIITLYYLNWTGGSGTFTAAASFASANSNVHIGVISVKNCRVYDLPASQIETQTANNISSDNISVSLTISEDLSFAVSGAVCGNATAFTSTNNTIRSNESAASSQLGTGTIANISGSSQTSDFTNTGANRLAMIGSAIEPLDNAFENFPVLVELNKTLFTQVQDDGDDIVFTDSTGALLSYEIEENSGSSFIAWVKIPELSGAEDVDIYVYYGNNDSTSLQNISDVWSNNYDNVYHLNNDPSGGAGSITDSVGNNDGTPNNIDSTSLVVGKIDSALTFDGVDQDVLIGNSYQVDADRGTVSFWLKRDETSRLERPFGYADNLEFVILSGDDTIRADFFDRQLQSTTTLNNTNFYYVVKVWDNITDEAFLYINGNLEAYSTIPEGFPFPGSARIGSRSGVSYFKGIIDEFRIADFDRSPAWVATEFSNQNNPSNFYTIDNEESLPSSKVTDAIILIEVAWRTE